MLPTSVAVAQGGLGALLVGLVGTTHIRCMYSVFGREFTKYVVMYNVYLLFWPTLFIGWWTSKVTSNKWCGADIQATTRGE